ncbi:MAG TPA: PAS domain S-box protein, partial [Methanocella sp.]
MANKIAGDNSIAAALATGDKAAIKQVLNEFKSRYPSIDIMTVADKNAIVMGRSTSDATGDRASDATMQQAIAGTEVATIGILPAAAIQANGLQSKVTQGTGEGIAFLCAVPVKDENDQVVGGVVCADLQNSYNELMDRIASESGGFSSVYQGDVRVATSLKDTGGNRLVGTKLDADIYARVQNGQTVTGIFPDNGQQLFKHVLPLKDSNGKVIGALVTGYDVSGDVASINNTMLSSMGIGAVIAVLGALAGFFVVGRTVKPINKLVVAANGVAAGDLDTPIETGANGGEVGVLTESVKKMVVNIKERIAYNESILRGISDPLSVYDTERNITYMNDVAAKAIGVNAKDVIGKKCYDVYTSPACQTSCAVLECWKRKETIKGFETTVKAGNGQTVCIRGNASPIMDTTGKIVGGMELFQDITQEKATQETIVKAEKESREKALFSDSVLKAVTESHFVFDPKGNLTYINDVAQKLLAVSERDVLGRSIEDVLGVSNSNARKALTEQRNVINAEGRVIARGGREIQVLVNVSLLKDLNGNVTGINSMFKDITADKAAQVAIAKAEKEAREKALFSDSILKAITDAHAVTDVKGNMIYVNEVALKLLGWSEKDALGRSLEDITGVANTRTRTALTEQKNITNAEGHVVSRSGREIPVLVNATLLKDINGNVTGLNTMFRDITKEKEAKRQLAEITVSANRIAERVSGASGNVASSVQQVMSASRQISESIQQIASGSQTQARSIESVNKLMHDMGNSIANVTEGARKTSEDAVQANIVAKKGSENAKIAIRKMEDLHVAVNDSAVIVKDLGEKSKKIGQIVEMITAIAGQTNLLALNAAIEAARAGDAGRGFAVVAEEVRKLAEEAAKAAEEINSLIGEVREQTARAVESMNKGTREVDESNKIVAESLKSLEDIGRLVDTTAAKAQEIAAMTEKQAADTQRVVKDVEEMAAVIEQSAAGTEEVGASSEETTSTAEQVAGMAGEL